MYRMLVTFFCPQMKQRSLRKRAPESLFTQRSQALPKHVKEAFKRRISRGESEISASTSTTVFNLWPVHPKELGIYYSV